MCECKQGFKSDWIHIWKRNLRALEIVKQDDRMFRYSVCVQGHTMPEDSDAW